MIEEIKDVIRFFGINGENIILDSHLGETGVGFDSQEIVEFTCKLEERFAIKLPACTLNKKSSIEDVIRLVQEKQKINSVSQTPFEGKVETSIFIKSTPEQMYNAIYEMEKWPEKLPHVKRIETLYNDGIYQEFLMDVQSEKGLICVRSIRRCLPDEGIVFFQPQPPKFLKHHCGGWSFQKEADGCNAKTWHQWNLNKEYAEQMFPPQEQMSTQERVANTLLAHAELALSTWKQLLEKQE